MTNKKPLRKPKTSRTKARGKVRPDGFSDAYRPEYDLMVTKLPPPVTNSQIAFFLDISIQTLHNWKERHPSFAEAIQKAKDRVDDEMENAFYQRGLGYTHQSEKIFLPARSRTPVRVPFLEHYPPDTAAAISWLKNRRPETWRDHPEGGSDDSPPPVKVVIEMKDAKRNRKES